jgi:organizing structure protein 2
MNYFLPKTSHNLSSYLSSLERAHAPTLADTHEQVNQRLASTTVAARDVWDNSRSKTARSVERAVSKLQDRTGLKLREAVGWGQGAIAKAEAEAKDAVDLVEKKVDDLRK